MFASFVEVAVRGNKQSRKGGGIVACSCSLKKKKKK
jgi:hypothetical protein